MSTPSNVVDLGAPGANMYGCQPCPMCKERYRCVFNNKPGVIQCDDCGHHEPIATPAEPTGEGEP